MCHALDSDSCRLTSISSAAFRSKDPAAFSHLDDPRQCALCLKYGDADSKVKATMQSSRLWGPVLGTSRDSSPLCPQEAGRLLYIGQNEWTHVNCAIWSAEVFEENDGSLKNVHAAVARGRQMVRTWAQKGEHFLGSQVGTSFSVELT